MQADPLVKESGFVSQESVEILLQLLQDEIESMADFVVESEGVERLENIQEFKATVHSLKFLINLANPFVSETDGKGVMTLLELQDRMTDRESKKAKLISQINQPKTTS